MLQQPWQNCKIVENRKIVENIRSTAKVESMYRVTLNNEKPAKGKSALLKIAFSLKHHEKRRCGANLFEKENQSRRKENFSSTSESEDEDFQKLLDRQAKCRKTHTEDAASNLSPLRLFKMDFNNALTDMENIDKLSKMTVMDAISPYPAILQKVAYTVTALPSTQVSVERLYSALRIIHSDLRTSMKDDLLEAILFLRTNGCEKLCVKDGVLF